jgi:glycosyltransferase involved in cell wall biosynthesis
MNILFLDQFSELGGAQLCLLDLLPALRDQGWQAWVAAPGEGPLLQRAREQGAQTCSLRFGPFESGWRSPLSLARFTVDSMRLAKQLAVILHQSRAGLIYVNGPRLLPAAAAAAGTRIPIVFHAHNVLPRPLAPLLAGRSMQCSGAQVVASSNVVAAALSRYVLQGNLQVVRNGVADCARPRLTKRGRGPTVGVIGRISREKGQAVFLKAAHAVYRAMPKCRFLICGAALFSARGAKHYSSELSALSQGLPVEFSGWTDDVAEALAKLDVLVVPSLAPESSPRVILEAFSAGVPVIAFAVGGIPELISQRQNGMLVDSQTPEALAEAIRGLLSQGSEALVAMGARARRDWAERFTVGRYQSEIVELLGRGSFGSLQQAAEEEGR